MLSRLWSCRNEKDKKQNVVLLQNTENKQDALSTASISVNVLERVTKMNRHEEYVYRNLEMSKYLLTNQFKSKTNIL